MIYLLDSNAVRDLMNQHPRLTDRVARVVPPDTAAVCSVVLGEVRFGIERLPAGRRRDVLAEKARAVFQQLGAEHVPYAAGADYARLKRVRERAGMPMDENDLWLAATAIALGATVVTRDSDFRGTPGLLIEDGTV
jgi:hypothetical protein